MKAVLVLVSMLFASSFAFGQIAPPDQRQPQESVGWTQITSPVQTVGTAVTSQPNGTVWLGSLSGLFRSTNGGESWDAVPGAPGGWVAFFNDTDAIEALSSGGGVRLTTDGGGSWFPGNSTEMNGIWDFTLVGDSTVFACGLSNVSKSTDRGMTWYNRQLDASSLEFIAFADTLVGYVLGGISSGSDIGTGFKTTDGGVVWNRLQMPLHDYSSIQVLSRDTILVGSYGGHILKSVDGGLNWKRTFSALDSNIYDIHFINHQTGYATGNRGLILRTNDGGETWVAQTTPQNKRLYDIHFVNDMLGFASGADGLLLRTTNGGRAGVTVTREVNLDVKIEFLSRSELAVEYRLAQPDRVSLTVFNAEGRELLKPLNNMPQPAQLHRVIIDVSTLTQGNYYFTLSGSSFGGSGSIAIIR